METKAKEAEAVVSELPRAEAALPVVSTAPAQAGVVVKQEWTRERIELLKRTVAKGATDDELQLFIEVCAGTGLNPFAKQIYAIKRRVMEDGRWRDSLVFQTGIDGYRLIAERTKKYEGQGEAEWCGPDGVWEKVWLRDEHPAAARVPIYRKGFREPMWGLARWDAYAQTNKDGGYTKFWATMGPEQLAKCAEALALRKAFPQELSGVYTHEELAQADTPTTISTSATTQKSQGLERDEHGVILYPKAPYKGVALNAKYDSDSGKEGYIIPPEHLAKMLRALDNAINEKQSAGAEAPVEWAVFHDAIVDELERRNFEDSGESKVEAQMPATEEKAAEVAKPTEQKASPDDVSSKEADEALAEADKKKGKSKRLTAAEALADDLAKMKKEDAEGTKP